MPTVTDDFNRADENPLSGGGNWLTCDESFEDLEIDGQAVHGTRNNQDQFMYWAGDTFDIDHYCQIVVIGNGDWSLATRINPSDNDSFYNYYVASLSSVFLYRVDNGSFNQLGSEFNPQASENDTFKQISNGSNHSLEIEGVEEDSQSDGTYSTGHTQMGIGLYDNEPNYIDDFEGSDGAEGDLSIDVTDAPAAVDNINQAIGDIEVNVADCPKPIDKLL